MKHGKKPTAEQRKLISAAGLDASNWLVAKDQPERMLVRHRYTETTRTIEKRKKNGTVT